MGYAPQYDKMRLDGSSLEVADPALRFGHEAVNAQTCISSGESEVPATDEAFLSSPGSGGLSLWQTQPRSVSSQILRFDSDHQRSPPSGIPRKFEPEDLPGFQGHGQFQAGQRVERRLAAIVAADVVGYSRLMGADESGTLQRLNALRTDLIDPAIARHRGRIVKTMGDGLLLEFSSAVAAVECCVSVQQDMAARNSAPTGTDAIRFRIGVHVGDNIVQGDDIFGDGVNVASRMEPLSEPGGIALSDDAYRQVRDRVDVTWKDGGWRKLKNIDRSLRVWRWQPVPVLLNRISVLKHERLLPVNKPTIVVLPFYSMSVDLEQKYLANGIADDITAALSRVRSLLVVPRENSFTFCGQSAGSRDTGPTAGARYVLEGSIRRVAATIRISARLIDAETGYYIWAECFDRRVDDFFEANDEIITSLVGAVSSEIRTTECERAVRCAAQTLAVWDQFAKASWYLHKETVEDTDRARRVCLEAIEETGGNSEIYSALGYSYALDQMNGWSDMPPPVVGALALDTVKTAVSMDPLNDHARHLLAAVYWSNGDFDAAIREARVAIELNPNHSHAHHILGATLGYSGVEHHAEAIERIEYAIRLAPRDMWVHWMHANIAMLHVVGGRLDQAINTVRLSLIHNPKFGFGHYVLASALSLSGDVNGASEAWMNSLVFRPSNLKTFSDQRRREFRKDSEAEIMLEGLRLAGAQID